MEYRRRVYDEVGEIKKGPWKAEEDEVLINHVNKYGPRDWSSIRSKGLLHRTGKSCRLRWVNKLRPNLKNGVKFSVDEEKIVIELQGQFGNKWARIATYLPGRTDNDVKNFWSSRQKRLARILQNPPPQQPKPQKNTKATPSLHVVPTLEGPKFSSSPEEESSSKAQSCSSSYIDNPEPLNMVRLPEFMNPPALLNFEQNLLQLEFTPLEKTTCTDDSQQPELSFPDIPHLQTDLPLALESQELFTRLSDPNFFAVFGQGNASEIVQLPCVSPGTLGEAKTGSTFSLVQCEDCLICENSIIVGIETVGSSGKGGREGECENPATPDSFIDDFPMDMFDNIEPLPSPSEW